MKPRSKEEVEAILRDVRGEMRMHEVCEKYGISETALYRLLALSTGTPSKGYQRQESRVARLEKQLAERDKEIRLMRAALKKSSR